MKSDQNRVTLEAYERHVDTYLQNTPQTYTEKHEPLLRWIDSCIEHAPKGGAVLEIGSAAGREARYMRSKGLRVQCSDAVQGFVDYLNSTGEDAILFNFLEDTIPKRTYDMVFANAVIPHFTPDDLNSTLKRVRSSLRPGGLFAFSTKQGTGETWVREKIGEDRYIHYWQPEQLRKFVVNAGYEILFLENGTTGDIPSHIWINLIAKKTKKSVLGRLVDFVSPKRK